MTFKIGKQDQREIDGTLAELAKARAALEAAVAAYNEAIEPLWANVFDAIETYHSFRAGILETLERVAGELEEEFDERSESWRESEKGQAIEEWINSLRDFEMEEVELEEPEPLAIDLADPAEDLPPSEPEL